MSHQIRIGRRVVLKALGNDLGEDKIRQCALGKRPVIVYHLGYMLVLHLYSTIQNEKLRRE